MTAIKQASDLVRGDVVSHWKFFGTGVPVTVTDVRVIEKGSLSLMDYIGVSFYGVPEACACSHGAYSNMYADDEVVIHSTDG